MAVFETGTAILWGITNGGAPISIDVFASFILDDVKTGHKFKLTNVEDETENDASLIGTNSYRELELSFKPAGKGVADALGVASVILDPLDIITTTNFAVAWLNAKWIYVGDQQLNLTHKEAKMTVKVRKYDDPTQHASLSTPVT